MKYEELIDEELEELRALEKKQKLVQFEKRVRFLMTLKSGAAKTQKAAGSQVGWQVAAVAKNLTDVSGAGFGGRVREKWAARVRETLERPDQSAERVSTGIRSAFASGDSTVYVRMLAASVIPLAG